MDFPLKYFYRNITKYVPVVDINKNPFFMLLFEDFSFIDRRNGKKYFHKALPLSNSIIETIDELDKFKKVIKKQKKILKIFLDNIIYFLENLNEDSKYLSKIKNQYGKKFVKNVKNQNIIKNRIYLLKSKELEEFSKEIGASIYRKIFSTIPYDPNDNFNKNAIPQLKKDFNEAFNEIETDLKYLDSIYLKNFDNKYYRKIFMDLFGEKAWL